MRQAEPPRLACPPGRIARDCTIRTGETIKNKPGLDHRGIPHGGLRERNTLLPR